MRLLQSLENHMVAYVVEKQSNSTVAITAYDKAHRGEGRSEKGKGLQFEPLPATCATTPLLVVLWFAQQHTGLSLYGQFFPRVRGTTSRTSTEGEGGTVWHV